LTRTCLHSYRDCASRHLHPFPTRRSSDLDQYGVGELVAIGTRRGREVKPKLKVGICGEHGGDPRSIEFFNHVGLDNSIERGSPRSEEHTSELQSHLNLVYRLLLEKKNYLL